MVDVREGRLDELLHLALDGVLRQPAKPLQYWLDHHHGSYAHDIEVGRGAGRGTCGSA